MIVADNDKLLIEKLEIEIEHTGHITNTYIIMDKMTHEVMVIDPAFDEKSIKEEIVKLNGKPKIVLITHSHADHIAALKDLTDEYKNVKVYIHELDFDGLYDKSLNEEDAVKTKVGKVDKSIVAKMEDENKIYLGENEFEVLHTPGHTKGSIMVYNKEFDILFSGDTIFENTYGRTDLITGSHEDMKKSLDRVFNTFVNPLVFPGHGDEFYLENSKRKIRLLFAYKG